MTDYEEYYKKGKADKEAGRCMTLPHTMTILHAYRGYMDGWGNSPFNEPRASVITHKPRMTIKE